MLEHAQLTAREIRDPYTQLLVNLSGDNGDEWLAALKRFLRKENPWMKPNDLSILDKPIGEIFTNEVAIRHGIKHGKHTIRTLLRNDEVNTIQDLVKLSEAQLLRTPFLGPKYVGAIKEVLASYGLYLAAD